MQLLDGLGTAQAADSFLDSLCSGARLTASLVVSADGDFVGEDNSSRELSSPTDRAWLSALRRNSQVVITSGKTFRIEQYRMPKSADLAVLTRSDLSVDHLKPKPGQQLHILRDATSYRSAIDELLGMGYTRIHLEFGPSGIEELLKTDLDFSLFLSGPSDKALKAASLNLGSNAKKICQIENLVIAIAR